MKQYVILVETVEGDGRLIFFRYSHSLTHLLTYSLTYSLSYSLTHLLTHSLTHLLTYSLTHSPVGYAVSFIVYLKHVYSIRPSDRDLYTIDLTGGYQAGGNHMVTFSLMLTHSCLLTHSLTHSLMLTHSIIQMQMTFNVQFEGVDENDVKEIPVKWLDHLQLYTSIGLLLTHSHPPNPSLTNGSIPIRRGHPHRLLRVSGEAWEEESVV